ncbi:MAG: hypothetical protein IJ762_07870 [Bacteroidaceae bacterium]|nr:hypothetical protein [Bacteroidaceae bacterium]
MKRTFFLFFVMLLFAAGLFATSDGEGKPVHLIIRTGGEYDQIPKSPILVPVVYLDGHILSFDESLEGCTVQLLDENENIVFSHSIEENQTSVTFPGTLSGTYELQIVCGDIMFYAFIEL